MTNKTTVNDILSQAVPAQQRSIDRVVLKSFVEWSMQQAGEPNALSPLYRTGFDYCEMVQTSVFLSTVDVGITLDMREYGVVESI